MVLVLEQKEFGVERPKEVCVGQFFFLLIIEEIQIQAAYCTTGI